MGKATEYKGGATVGISEVAGLLGKSYVWTHNKLQYSEKFMRECKNKTPNSRSATYAYHDIIRFRDLSDWGV